MKLYPHILFRLFASIACASALVLVIGAVFALPAFAQDGGPGTSTPASDYSNLLTLLKALSGPLTPIVVGFLVSAYAERWKWFQALSVEVKRFISAVLGALLAMLAYWLLTWLPTLPADVLANVQTYFALAFTAIVGVLAQTVWHSQVNKPLSG